MMALEASVPAVLGVTIALGLVVGSFLNVAIARLPRHESLVWPRSRCPACGHQLRWYDNIPLLSFLWLRARCRDCAHPISWRYLIIEAVTAGLFTLTAWQIGWSIELVPAWLFLAALVAITAIDLEHQIIPDAITLPGIVVGFVSSLVTPGISWLESLIGILVGGGLLLGVILASGGGMGGGDMKLAAMMGAFLGYKLALVALLLAVLSGGLIAVAVLLIGFKGRKEPIPFGPFLALGSAVALIRGEGLLHWYLSGFIG